MWSFVKATVGGCLLQLGLGVIRLGLPSLILDPSGAVLYVRTKPETTDKYRIIVVLLRRNIFASLLINFNCNPAFIKAALDNSQVLPTQV